MSSTDELMNGVGRMLRVGTFDIYFRDKLMKISYQVPAPLVSSLLNSSEFKNEGIKENTQ